MHAIRSVSVHPDALESCRVLLAEDDEDTQLLITQIFKKAGATVVTVGNGQECVEQALDAWHSKTPFDMILVDIQMPILDGVKATRALREQGYTMPIVAMTARSTLADEQEALSSGCNSYISKLGGKDKLLETVTKELRFSQKENTGLEIPVLPIVPDILRQSPEYARPVVKFLDGLDGTLHKLRQQIENQDYKGVKHTAVELGKASLYGYSIFAEFLHGLQLAAEAEKHSELTRLFPQLERAALAMKKGKPKIQVMQ